MKTKEFVAQLDDERIVAAIGAAEKKCSGEIRVYVSSHKREDAFAAARERFVKLGMTQTRERNAVLIYFAPVSQQFAIIGDEGIHAKCGQSFWEQVRDAMAESLQKHRYTEAVLIAVDRVGALLAQHFPPRPGDENELPNRVERD